MPKKFTVEQGYTIAMLFFFGLWPILEPNVREEEARTGTYSLFFVTIPTGDDWGEAIWNETIRLLMQIPKKEQGSLQLSLPEIFACCLKFCKFHNEQYYEGRLIYGVQLLENMQADPKGYSAEWAIWKDAVEKTLHDHMDCANFDWNAKLPTWNE